MASFIITKDIIENGEFNNWKAGDLEYLEQGKAKHEFRLLDDDRNIYFYGKCGNSSSFSPLDAFGTSFGCTEIQYKNKETNKWETL